MRLRKHERHSKRQLGQFMTPRPLARSIVERIRISDGVRVLEPSCGDGSFIEALLGHLHDAGKAADLLAVELDPLVACQAQAVLDAHPSAESSVHVGDFFRAFLAAKRMEPSPLRLGSFDFVIGNPPFGGTFDHDIEDELDRELGERLGRKIKKETYAFFIVACQELLKQGGRLVFICSDSLLTIPTMTGLRNFLMSTGSLEITDVQRFSGETTYPMVVLDYTKGVSVGSVTRNGLALHAKAISATPNQSWSITPELARLFENGRLLTDVAVASSGMTTGKNALFVRDVHRDSEGPYVLETHQFSFVLEKITVAHELERARLGVIPPRRRVALEAAESRGDVERRVVITERRDPVKVRLPDPRYRPYNKANQRVVFSDATHMIFWENDGDAVLTYKRTGNWYLRGVGGQPFFGREGLTWQLVASRWVPRYLPTGYILDSGAPCAFLRPDVDRSELYFLIGWLLTPMATRVLKTVLNHTRNIQSKDFERMPYPWWVTDSRKMRVVALMRTLIEDARRGRRIG